MAEDNKGDVDRAVAAFAALPMPYFTPAPLLLDEASGSHEVKSDHGVTFAFPLLLAALPGINQAPMPVPPTGTSDKPRSDAADAKKTELLARRAAALCRPAARPPEMMSSPQQTGRAPNLSAVFGLPVRQVPTQGANQPAGRPHVTNTTPIAAMFQALNSTGPALNQPAEARPGLQNIFSRL